MPLAAVASRTDLPDWDKVIARSSADIAKSRSGRPHLLFVGDSITASWDLPILDLFFRKLNPFLLGVSGDTTNGVLWRIDNLDWPSLRPSVVIVLIGTNNVARGNNVDDVALGIAEVVRKIRVKAPDIKIAVLEILPRGRSPADPLRLANDAVNKLLSGCADGTSTIVVDASSVLLDGAGRLPSDMSFDAIHLTPKAYYALAQFLAPKISALMSR